MEYNVKPVKDRVGKGGSIKVSVCVPIYGVEEIHCPRITYKDNLF